MPSPEDVHENFPCQAERAVLHATKEHWKQPCGNLLVDRNRTKAGEALLSQTLAWYLIRVSQRVLMHTDGVSDSGGDPFLAVNKRTRFSAPHSTPAVWSSCAWSVAFCCAPDWHGEEHACLEQLLGSK